MPPSLSGEVLPNVGETLAAYSRRMREKGVEVRAEGGRISLRRSEGVGGVWMMTFDMKPADLDGPGFGQAFRDRVAEIEARAAQRHADALRRREEAERRRGELMEQRTARLEEMREARMNSGATIDAQRRALEAERAALEAERRALEVERRAFEAARRR